MVVFLALKLGVSAERFFKMMDIPGFKKLVLLGGYRKVRDTLLRIAQFPDSPYVFKRIQLSKWGNGEVIKIGYRLENGPEVKEKGTILFLVNNLEQDHIEVAFKSISKEMEAKFLSLTDDSL